MGGAREGGSGRDLGLPVGVSALAAILLFWLTASPAAQQLAERQLGFHHVLHWLQFGAGLVLAVNWRGRFLRHRPGLAATAVSAAFAYVLVAHLPWPLDRAALLPVLHLALHAGFFAAGALAGIAWRDVPELPRLLIVLATMGLMTILALAEISGSFAYTAYPAGQEAASGIVMLAGMGLFWVGLAFAGVPARLSRRAHPAAGTACVAVIAGLIALSYWRA